VNTLLSVLALATLGLGCVGYGILALSVVKVGPHTENVTARLIFSFIIGVGFLGWVLFFPGVLGLFNPVLFLGVGAVGTALLLWQRGSLRGLFSDLTFTHIEKALLAVIGLILALDLLEGISPPADADSLAYHFALPRDFIADGDIGFVMRAVTGAIPMLVHMTYAAALGTGGELGLTLWTMVTGWAAGFLLYAIARLYLSRAWALSLLIVFLTTPAVLYGGGSGQVEVRAAAFALAAGAFIVAARRHDSYRLFALAGACAGCFIGAKFFGLAFAGAAGLFVLFSTNGLKRAFVFAIAAGLAGFQWYLWNWIHTGDPVFPMLTNLLQFPDSAYWTQDFGRYFTAIIAHGELPLDRSLVNWLLYPVYATFNMVVKLEGGRTGFGILAAIILPAAFAGLCNRNLRRSDFAIPLLVAFVFFTVWFFSGTAQRTRHLLPIYPLLLLGLFPLAVEWARQANLVRPLAVGVAAAVALQLAGQAIFSFNYVRHVFTPETRPQFLARNVPGATSADWINRNLPADAKIAFMNRQLAYLIERPAFSMHPHIQAVIDARMTVGDGARFIRQVRRQGVTHLLLPEHRYVSDYPSTESQAFREMISRLRASGCLSIVTEIDTVGISSRTLSQFGAKTGRSKDAVFRLVPAKCPIETALRPRPNPDMT
jgi:hypothetical protein